MAEDVFSIKELREIILAYPQNLIGSSGSPSSKLPNLVHGASGNALRLGDQLRKRVLIELHQANQRLVLSKLAQRLDLGSKDLLSLLGEAEVRPQWCYVTGLHSLVPPVELNSLLRTLQNACSTSFVNFDNFCKVHDINQTDLRDYLRRINASRTDLQHLGIGKWYDETGLPAKHTEYVYSQTLLDNTRSLIRDRLQQATEDRQALMFGSETFHGLDASSFLCFAQKILEGLLDFNKDSIKRCSLTRKEDGKVVFTPSTAVAAEKEQWLQSFLERSDAWQLSGKPAGDFMPCLPLGSNKDQPQKSPGEVFREVSGLLKEMAGADRLVKIGNYAVTYRAIRTLADLVLAEIEESASYYLGPPRDVAAADAAGFLAQLYETIVTDFSSDEDNVVHIGHFVSLKTSVEDVKEVIGRAIDHEARKAWERHVETPEAVPFPDSVSEQHLIHAVTAAAPAGQKGFYEIVAKNEIGTSEKKRGAAHQLWKSAMLKQESDYDNKFSIVYSTHILARLNLHVLAIQSLDAGKLRAELAGLLKDHLLSNFLTDSLSQIQESSGLKTCGRRVDPAVNKLTTQLADYPSPSADPEEDLGKLSTLFNACGTKFKASPPTADKLVNSKLTIEHEIFASAGNTKTDKDGSRAFLCVVLALWARQNEGFMYATGRFVPRLLKLLKGKIDEKSYERLQELKDVVKGGNMTNEQREELIGFVKG